MIARYEHEQKENRDSREPQIWWRPFGWRRGGVLDARQGRILKGSDAASLIETPSDLTLIPHPSSTQTSLKGSRISKIPFRPCDSANKRTNPYVQHPLLDLFWRLTASNLSDQALGPADRTDVSAFDFPRAHSTDSPASPDRFSLLRHVLL